MITVFLQAARIKKKELIRGGLSHVSTPGKLLPESDRTQPRVTPIFSIFFANIK